MDIHCPAPTAVTKVSSFCSCTQKHHHFKMFTGQTGAKRREDSSNEANRRSTAALAVAGSPVFNQVNLADIRIGFQGRQFGGRIWKIWFHLSICIWPSNGSISFRCYAGKEILWWRSGCSNLSLILVWFTCKCCWTVLLYLLSSMFCGNCSLQLFQYQWLLDLIFHPVKFQLGMYCRC